MVEVDAKIDVINWSSSQSVELIGLFHDIYVNETFAQFLLNLQRFRIKEWRTGSRFNWEYFNLKHIFIYLLEKHNKILHCRFI